MKAMIIGAGSQLNHLLIPLWRFESSRQTVGEFPCLAKENAEEEEIKVKRYIRLMKSLDFDRDPSEENVQVSLD